MARFFQRWPSPPTRSPGEVPEEGAGSATTTGAPHRRLPHTQAGRARIRQRSQRVLANRAVRDAIVSLAGVVGRPVRNQGGAEIGRLVDVVCRWSGEETYPPVTGLVVRVGHRLAFVGASAIDRIEHSQVLLKSARLDLVDFAPRPGEVTLAEQVLDHQLVDVDGVQVIRAADLYLAPVLGPVPPRGRGRLGPEPAPAAGPGPLAATPRRPTGSSTGRPSSPSVRPSRGRPPRSGCAPPTKGCERLRPGELADLLEDLCGPSARACWTP